MTKAYTDIYYKSPDGLSLYARDYGNKAAKYTLLCMHGLTRNSKDFHNLALHYRSKFRVISVDQRGRGKSAYDSTSENYQPSIYCQDMFALIAHLSLTNIIAVGTSMGGLMAMMMAATQHDIFKGVVLNDIGPVVEAAGLQRIQGYVGDNGPFKTWSDAEHSVKQQGPAVFPNYGQDDWANFAKRTCEKRADGLIHFAYDPAISEAVKATNSNAVPPNLWPLYEGFSATPLLVVRGAISDILSQNTLEKMRERLPNCQTATIPNIGHAPMLDEPESLMALDNFLEQFVD